MGFYDRFELLELLRDDGVKTFRALEISSQRAVEAHLFVNPYAPLSVALLARIEQLPQSEHVRILDRGTHEGTPYLVTEPLLGYPCFRDWVTAKNRPQAETPAEHTLVLKDEPGNTGNNPLVINKAGAWQISRPNQPPVPVLRPTQPGGTPPVPSALDQQFANLFPSGQLPSAAPPHSLGEGPGGPGANAAREGGTMSFGVAQNPPSYPPGSFPPESAFPPAPAIAPSERTELKPGSVARTRTLELPVMKVPSELAETRETPSASSGPAPGSFTQMFAQPLGAEPQVAPETPGAEVPVAEAPAAEARVAEEPVNPYLAYWKSLQEAAQAAAQAAAEAALAATPEAVQAASTVAPQAAPPAAPPTTPVPPANTPGEFTQLFAAQKPAAAAKPTAPGSSGAQAPGEFTQLLAAQKSAPPPPRPSQPQAQASGPGEFTQLFEAQHMAPAAPAAPQQAPPVKQPAVSPPGASQPGGSQPSAGQPGAFTQLFQAQNTIQAPVPAQTYAAPPAAPEGPGEFTRLMAAQPAVAPTSSVGQFARPQFSSPQFPPPQGSPAQQPGEFTRMLQAQPPNSGTQAPNWPPQQTSSPPLTFPPGAQTPGQPGQSTGAYQAPVGTPMGPQGGNAGGSGQGEFTRFFEAPIGPMPQSPALQQPMRPVNPSGTGQVGEFTRVFGPHGDSAPQPLSAPLGPPMGGGTIPGSGATQGFAVPAGGAYGYPPGTFPPAPAVPGQAQPNPYDPYNVYGKATPGDFTQKFAAPGQLTLGQGGAPLPVEPTRMARLRPYLPWILGIVALVLVIAVVIVILLNRKK